MKIENYYKFFHPKLKKYIFENLPKPILIFLLNINPNYKFIVTRVKKNIYKLESDNLILFLCRPSRLFKYKFGLLERLNQMKVKYFLDEVIFHDKDVIIDCGSNLGEVPLAIRSIFKCSLRVIAIEPDPLEFNCLIKNLTNRDLIYNEFISSESKLVQVKYDNNFGDTSIITNEHTNIAGKIITTRSRTLDSIITPLKIESIKLLKIEVEGSEPEVLQGATEILKICKYVAIDCGPERGFLDTFDEVCSILENLGFYLIKHNKRYSVLFINLIISSSS
jgi:FkbM family methyltransferase